jgi:hypothetical protein
MTNGDALTRLPLAFFFGRIIVSVALISLTLFVVIETVRSYEHVDGGGWYGPPYPGANTRWAIAFDTGRGGFAFVLQIQDPQNFSPFPLGPNGFNFTFGTRGSVPRYASDGWEATSRLGFAVIDSSLLHSYGIVVPGWSILGMLVVFGLATLRLNGVLIFRMRRSQNCCVHCGYDLRGSSDRCPECGQKRRS